MHYFFLEKQSPLTQRWQLRQVAFDSKYRYLYYTKALSRSDVEEVIARSQDGEHMGFDCSTSFSTTSSKKVKWSGKLKVAQLRYAADEYLVPPGHADFDECILLTLIVIGYERPLEKHRGSQNAPSSASRSCGGVSERSASLWSTTTHHHSTSRISSVRFGDSDHDEAVEEEEGAPGESQRLLAGAAADVPAPEPPSGFLHMPSYPVNESLNEDFEDEEENMFRDIDLVPDLEDEDDAAGTSAGASEVESEPGSEAEHGDDEGDDVAVNSPPKSPTESARSGYSFFSLRQHRASGGGGGGGKDERRVQLQFRAANYDIFRIVSLRIRQALVRHGLCGPLHAGLPPYDPRNGIALATVPLHLRHAFRRLNDVVFYSLQIGHVVYVRQQREVRGMEGYLCITHDSVLLLQLDGKCPRWLDLEDIVGVQYVLHSNQSFISIRAAEPYPDFVFIPIIPSYPPHSTFDAEECVEGIVSMVRRLLMQRLRAGEAVALPPLSSRRVSLKTAEEVEDYDMLCHIQDVSKTYVDVFKYIAQEQTTGAVALRWRWDNSKTPTHFTFKRDLFHALEREEGEDSEEEEEQTSLKHSLRRTDGQAASTAAVASQAHLVEAMVPSRQQPHLGSGGTRLADPSFQTRGSGNCTLYPAGKGQESVPQSPSYTASSLSPSSSGRREFRYANASFMPATMTQLMAPPSRGAELRAKRRLLVTRTDRRNASAAETAASRGIADAATVPRSPSAMTTPAFTEGRATAAQSPASAHSDLPAGVSSYTAISAAAEPSSMQLSGALPSATATLLPPSAAASNGLFQKATPAPPVALRAPSSKPNTYGLVPSEMHSDPNTLDFWFTSAAPPVSPVATAPKGVQLSDIQTCSSQVHASGSSPAPQQPPYQAPARSNSSLGMEPCEPLDVPGAGQLSNFLEGSGALSLMSRVRNGDASDVAVGSTSSCMPAPTGCAPLPLAATMVASLSGVCSHSHATHAPSSSTTVVPQESITNGSRSIQEVTHTRENSSCRYDDHHVDDGNGVDEEESDEDFDSEDMEDMLQRPSSLALVSPPLVNTSPSTAVILDAALPIRAGDHGAPAAGPAFIPVGGGVVTQVVLTAEMLPGFSQRDKSHSSEEVVVPSPNLQVTTDRHTFLPPPTAQPH